MSSHLTQLQQEEKGLEGLEPQMLTLEDVRIRREKLNLSYQTAIVVAINESIRQVFKAVIYCVFEYVFYYCFQKSKVEKEPRRFKRKRVYRTT